MRLPSAPLNLLAAWLATELTAPCSAFLPLPRSSGSRGLLAPTTVVVSSATVDETDAIRKTKAEPWRRQDLFGTTLVDETMERMKTKTVESEKLTKEERAQRRRSLEEMGVPSFRPYVQERVRSDALKRRAPAILQLNVGLYCNQACDHCHVESSPLRKESMTPEIAAKCLELLKSTPSVHTLDITGGAPELNAHFRYLVKMARAMRPGDDFEIIDRCNLTVLQEPGQEDLVQFLKDNRVRVVASLPCYTEDNVDKQRGRGVFDRSVAALLALNEAGYGLPGSKLELDLVYNPMGAYLPGDQADLEAAYKQQLFDNYGIVFNKLFTIANMPIKRFADHLHRNGQMKEYMDLLVNSFNGAAVKGLMCLDTVSVGYDGRIYDCDFNQQLGMGVGPDGATSIFDLKSLADLGRYEIRTDKHCFGCTAGQGSSCQGATAVTAEKVGIKSRLGRLLFGRFRKS